MIHCWGRNNDGQLGYENSTHLGDEEGEMPPRVVEAATGGAILQIVAGLEHTCARLDTGQVHCWGNNQYGQLGQGHTDTIGDRGGEMPPLSVDLGGKAVQLVTGANHACALLDTGNVRCWGQNLYGQLGYGDTANIGDDPEDMPPDNVNLVGNVTKLVAGTQHTCALFGSGEIRCWGRNNFGQLGYGNRDNIGDEAGEMPPSPVEIGGSVTQIAAGGQFNCALLTSDVVRCWGRNQYGQLGYGNTRSIGDGPGEMPPGDVPIADVAEITASVFHICARLTSGASKCWGHNHEGQLGYGHMDNIGDDPDEMPPDDVLVTNDNDGADAVAQLAPGRHHTCARLDSGAIRCWGNSTYGQLGYGNNNHLGDQPGEMPPPDVDIGESLISPAP